LSLGVEDATPTRPPLRGSQAARGRPPGREQSDDRERKSHPLAPAGGQRQATIIATPAGSATRRWPSVAFMVRAFSPSAPRDRALAKIQAKTRGSGGKRTSRSCGARSSSLPMRVRRVWGQLPEVIIRPLWSSQREFCSRLGSLGRPRLEGQGYQGRSPWLVRTRNETIAPTAADCLRRRAVLAARPDSIVA